MTTHEHEPREAGRRRIFLLGSFLAVVLLNYAAVLYHTQITNGAYYLEQSVRTITRSETIQASRGIITDRNGQTLVSNRQTYNLTFDSSLLDGTPMKTPASCG